MSDRGYAYSQTPRSPVMRSAHPARSSANTISSSRDPYHDSYYSNPRSSAPSIPRSDHRQFEQPVPYRSTRDDYDVPVRRLAPEPRGYEGRQRAGSAVGESRRPLSIMPPSAADRDRARPQVSSAGLDRPRGFDNRGDYYVQPARTAHGRHLSADVDDRGRYTPVYARHPPSYAEPPRDSRDAGRYYAADPRRSDDGGLARRVVDNGPRGGAHLYPEHAGRPRAGSDAGVRDRPNLAPEYVRERPRGGPPPSTRGFDKLDRGLSKQVYRVPREDTTSNTSSAASQYRQNTDPPERRRFNEKPVTLHQDYEYGGYSDADDRGPPRRDQLALPSHRHAREESKDRTRDRDRRVDDRYGSDTERQKHHKHHRDPSSRRERRQRDESVDRHSTAPKSKRDESEDRFAATRIEDDSRRHKSRRDDDREDERHHRRHEDKDRDRDRERDRDRDRDRGRDKDREREEKEDKSDRNRKIVETLGLGGAGAAFIGLAREAIKKRTGLGGDSEDEKETEMSDRYGDDNMRRRRRDETDDERKERHRQRRENETEEERDERRRKRRERRDGKDREKGEDEGNERSRDERPRDERPRDGERSRDDGNSKDGDSVRDKLASGGLGGAAGAALGALAGTDNKPRDRSRARFEDDEKSKDDSGRRRRRKKHSSESDTSSSSESDMDRDRAPPMRSRANSSARPAPPKGILKQPTQKFPENQRDIREGVAPLKDAKGHKGIPPTARWTKIDRRLVNPAALAAAQERFEERTDHVIVLRVLTREEIEKFARKTQELREERHKHGSDLSSDKDDTYNRENEEQRRMDEEAREKKPLAIEPSPHNVDSSMDHIVQQAAASNHASRNGSRNNSPPEMAQASHPAYAPPPQQDSWEAQQQRERERDSDRDQSQKDGPAFGRDIVQSPDSMAPKSNWGGESESWISRGSNGRSNSGERSTTNGSAYNGNGAPAGNNSNGNGNGQPMLSGAQPNGDRDRRSQERDGRDERRDRDQSR